MKKIILYSAMSLDGYIADEKGNIDWLFSDQDYGYPEFLAGIDTLLMGFETFRQVLDFGDWPYGELKTLVFSRHRSGPVTPGVSYIRAKIPENVESLRGESGKDIWLVGGGQLNTILHDAGLIDQMILSVHPVILGKGIPLLPDTFIRSNWKTAGVQTFSSGLIQLDLRFIET